MSAASRWSQVALGSLGLVAVALGAPRLYTELMYRAQILARPEAPAERVAVVFGAGLWRDGSPTPVLYDRVVTAVELYQAGQAQVLLMSGDGQTNNETNVMRKTALTLGVPAEALWVDPAGLDTYTTCLRARDVFGVQQALLVTQNFHLPRALLICEALGVQATGVIADRRRYNPRTALWWNFRELFATANALVEILSRRGITIP